MATKLTNHLNLHSGKLFILFIICILVTITLALLITAPTKNTKIYALDAENNLCLVRIESKGSADVSNFGIVKCELVKSCPGENLDCVAAQNLITPVTVSSCDAVEIAANQNYQLQLIVKPQPLCEMLNLNPTNEMTAREITIDYSNLNYP